jgi:hypothetical protein
MKIHLAIPVYVLWKWPGHLLDTPGGTGIHAPPEGERGILKDNSFSAS